MKQYYRICVKIKRHEELQDKTKLTAITSTTYETLRNTAGYLNEHRQQHGSRTGRIFFI